MEPALYILPTVVIAVLLAVVATLSLCVLVAVIYIRRNTVGTFMFDDNESSPMCTFALEKLPEDFEKRRYVLAKVERTDLSLPGSHKSSQ